MAEIGPDSGLEFFFDFDGLLQYVMNQKSEPPDYSVHVREGNVRQFEELHTSYYFEMRNGVAVFPMEGRTIDPSVFEERVSWIHRSLYVHAGVLAAREIETGSPVQPWWLDIFVQKYRAYMPAETQPLLDRVNFKVIHDGFLTAQADDAGNIIVSSKLKTFLQCFNIVVTSTELFGQHPEWLNQLDIGSWYFDHFFPYFLQPEIGFDLMRLPVIVAPDRKRFFLSQRLSEMQIDFLLLHEMAHVFLQHFGSEGVPRIAIDGLLRHFPTTPPKLYQEFEADSFALFALTAWPREAYHDLGCTAIEFLFSALNCMQETQTAVRGLLRPGYEAKANIYAERLSILRTLPVSDGWVDKDMKGWISLCEMFETLYLERLKTLTIIELETLVQHRKGPDVA